METLEMYRKWIEEALSVLKGSVSRETKWLYTEPPYQSLSFDENLLFALLLFRRKQKEEMLQAKALLSRLLSFQKIDGSFPCDLADTVCNDRYLPARAAFLFEIFLQDFGSVLGEETLTRVSSAKEAACSYLKKNEASLPWPQLEGFYKDLLLGNSANNGAFFDPTSFGKVLAALDYFPGRKEKDDLLSQACSFWDEKSALYCGPAHGVFHYGLKPVGTLFDYWMSYHTGRVPSQTFDRRALLDLALLHPSFKSLLPMPEKVVVETPSYALFPEDKGTFIATFEEPRPHLLRGFFPLRFVSGGVNVAWKFPHGKLVSFHQEGSRFVGKVQRDSVAQETLSELFVERIPEVCFEKNASLFNPFEGEVIDIGLARMRCTLLPFDGETLGLHCMGNRPGQLASSEEDAFDWVVVSELLRGGPLEYFSFSVEVIDSRK